MSFTITPAKRKAVPMLISLAGVSGSGKTYSALIMAAGLAGSKGTVGFLDTENRRGAMYADSPGIQAALPNSYEIAEMKEPFTPARYSEAVENFQAHGCNVLVIDSMTHEWEGYGGCSDIAENNKLKGMPNWSKAKMEHKRMMNHLLASNMHLIFCLRAREKVKIVKGPNGKEEFVQMGLQPIQEKNFTFEMTLSLLLDEHTHAPTVTKCPEPLLHLFQGNQPLVTKKMGERLKAWAEGGAPATADPEELAKTAILYAGMGTAAYTEFWGGLTNAQKAALLPRHEEFKALGGMADDRQKEPEEQSLVG